MDNIILLTDSYKLTHHKMYPADTDGVYSYFESRAGAKFPYTVFFGLQYILKEYLTGRVVSKERIDEAETLARAHFGNDHLFDRSRWDHILRDHEGRLPLTIKAVPEGTAVPTGNVLMTVHNTCHKCYWLTNAVESLLTHVWYPSTVATLSRYAKEMFRQYLDKDEQGGLNFMLHDFGYRGVSTNEGGKIGGAAHLVNFLGTDTLPAMVCAMEHYDAKLDGLAYSVAATEHSIMTSLGREGEMTILDNLIRDFPSGILSVVADSYDIYNFTKEVCRRKDKVLARDGVFVIRPDSITKQHNPEELVLWIAKELYRTFPGPKSSGRSMLDPKVRILWGDGLDLEAMDRILHTLVSNGFSAANMVFGMGGGLLQKVNRDTQRFAFKSSAQLRGGKWHDVYKEPLDSTKKSKRGILKLVDSLSSPGTLTTVNSDSEGMLGYAQTGEKQKDVMRVVFSNGMALNGDTFAAIRARAEGNDYEKMK